ncbi:hypothetical protein C499_04078 [Halogeometricum borinquense DSM 11551]|uniref:DUF8168 domain-containing protein n=1 Tax=Halogeometricum borinquense (strain ATCC 700274 / DSM 11551 / JCM 10706 / KCTC 4070 / PR3) TaxID=469382 RepID=L9UZP8_HALBP|nr:hypothetical protein C499_04078 [Halogeometricum borinquense DSM 11551]
MTGGSDRGDGLDECQPPSTEIRPVTEQEADAGEATSPTAVDGSASMKTDVGVSMLSVYRHDVHKSRGRSHADAAAEFAGVPVNEPVPLGADGDAALLSRPRGEPAQSVKNHISPFRLSLVTGETATSVGRVEGGIRNALAELVQIEDPVEMHAAWLESSVASIFNESVYYPYTSLKFHTLLTAALVDNYREGYGFDELYLVVDQAGDEQTDPRAVPHRTVLLMPSFGLRVTGEPGKQPAARLGAAPAQSWADVWTRLPEHPFDVDDDRMWRVVDAQLRRIRSWSTALQFIEESYAWWRTMQRRSRIGGGEQ